MRARGLGVTLGLCVAAVAMGACDEGQAFFIVQNQVPEPGCVIPGSEGAISLSQGTLDVSAGEGYQFFPLLRNDLPALKPAGDLTDRPEPNLLQLREYKVSLNLGSLQGAIPDEQLSFKRTTSGTMQPGSARGSQVEIFPPAVTQQLQLESGARSTVIAEVVAVAEDGDGDVVESLPFYYPIELCSGCLVVTLNSCPADGGASLAPNHCLMPQDSRLVCCKDGDLGLRCLTGAQ